MEFRNSLKKYINDFLMIQAGISLSIGIISLLSPPPAGMDPNMLFMPFVYAFFCTLPSLIVYSKKELSIRQMAVRKIIQFLLIELTVILISYVIGALQNPFMCTAIIIAVAVVYLLVNCFSYLISKSDANAMTQKIRHIKEQKKERTPYEPV